MTTGYLRFEELPSMSGKTKVVFVYSVRSGDLLAKIQWFGQWRCYALRPEPSTIWNIDCLKEINDRISSLMEQRKQVVG